MKKLARNLTSFSALAFFLILAVGCGSEEAIETQLLIPEEVVLDMSYPWGPSEGTKNLQTVLGIEADGWYGAGTRAAHLAELEARGMSVANVPPVPARTKRPKIPFGTAW